MRTIDSIIIHCSATKAGRNFTEKDIDTWHRTRGFSGIGYHWVVLLDGTLRKGRDESQTGAHCTQQRMNSRSIGICYIGGLDNNGRPADTRTAAQRHTLNSIIHDIRSRRGSNLKVYGHRDFAPKACPCFDAAVEYN